MWSAAVHLAVIIITPFPLSSLVNNKQGLTYMVRSTPTLPFRAPPRVRNSRACQKLVAKPKPRHEMQVPTRPKSRTVLRPHDSERRPHSRAVTNWAAVKEACRTPAWLEMVESGRSGSNHLSW